MKNISIQRFMKGLGIITPFLYIALGCLLLTNILPGMDGPKMKIFSIIIILYGIFRVYRLYVKFRAIDEE